MITEYGSILEVSFLCCVAVILFSTVCRLIFFRETKSAPNGQPEVVAAIEPHATVVDATRSWTKLEPTGREVFFAKPPHDGYIVYELTLSGTLSSDQGRADAFHRTDIDGNFCWGMDWLRIGRSDLKYIDHEFIAQDRSGHRYTLRFAYAGHLTLSLKNARYGWGSTTWHGGLIAELCVLPADTMTTRQRAEIERKRVEEERVITKAKAEAAAEAARFAEIVQMLSIRAELNRNWRDPQYREKFARAHGDQLLGSQAEIRRNAEELLQQTQLVNYLQRHAPTVVPTLLGRLESLLLAENLEVDKALAALEAAKPTVKVLEERPKRKRTSKEVMDLKVRHQQIHLGDKVALAMDKVETVENVKARVREKYGHLEEDEQQRIIQEILDQIHEEENQHAKTL